MEESNADEKAVTVNENEKRNLLVLMNPRNICLVLFDNNKQTVHVRFVDQTQSEFEILNKEQYKNTQDQVSDELKEFTSFSSDSVHSNDDDLVSDSD